MGIEKSLLALALAVACAACASEPPPPDTSDDDAGCELDLMLDAYVVMCPPTTDPSLPRCAPPPALADEYEAGIPIGCNVAGGGCECPCQSYDVDAARILCPL